MDLFYCMLLGCLSLATQIHGQEPQDKSGFISIDCGTPEPEGYNEGETYYSSDANFVNTGINSNISAEYKTNLNPRLVSLRSFPQGNRTCYTLKPKQGKNNTYLIRAWFLYGNYDGQNKPPAFDLYIGVNLWEKLATSMNTTFTTEIMYQASTDYIHVCLLNTGAGTPFISALELKHLNGLIYKSESGCMAPYMRNFMGFQGVGATVTDDLGRSWSHYNMRNSENISTMFPINSQSSNDYHLPLGIMKKGVKALNAANGSLDYYLDQGGSASNFYVYLHFCDVDRTQNDNQLREFNILLNSSPWLESVEPVYLTTTTLHNEKPIWGGGFGEIWLSLVRTNRSALPPILNALEIYVEKELPQSPTVSEDGMLLSYIFHLFVVDAFHCIQILKRVPKRWNSDEIWSFLFLKPWDKNS